jgi:SRSO17 transposase
MHHFVAKAPWDAAELLAVARDYALPRLRPWGAIEAWTVHDTGYSKRGKHSVGVARQVNPDTRKRGNCQVVLAVCLANFAASVPCSYRLLLPEAWTARVRRRKAAIPAEVRFQTNWEIALDAIDTLCRTPISRAPIVAGPRYGMVTEFRSALTARGLPYVVGIPGETVVWPLDKGAHDGRRAPAQTLSALAAERLSTIRWDDGSGPTVQSRFSAIRVSATDPARNFNRIAPEWLLTEWPGASGNPAEHWLSTLPATSSVAALARAAKMKCRAGHTFGELKQEFGLAQYEGRGWRGFHNHGVLCIAAYAFVMAERARRSPRGALAFSLSGRSVPSGSRRRS